MLAGVFGFGPGDYDLRSNAGGCAVSGEVTLHADRLYVQANQPATGADTGILIRSCDGRRDYVGGRNHFASLDLLHEPRALARLIRRYGLPRYTFSPRTLIRGPIRGRAVKRERTASGG